MNILIDPVFSERCSPVSFVGGKRFSRPPVSADDLPQLDLVILSHDQMCIRDRCTLLIILLVMGFSYGCMRKLNKVSAITAIHGGQTGERYGKRAGLRLYRRKRMPVTIFLGVNDMFSHVKRYLVLMITFCISFILITIPLNTINTMQSEEMARQFCACLLYTS